VKPTGANLVSRNGNLPQETRSLATGRRGGTVWFTGTAGSGRSALAAATAHELVRRGVSAYVLDEHNLRHGLTQDLGFSPRDRGENARRVAEVAAILADAGVVALVALVSDGATGPSPARAVHHGAGLDFIEVWVDTPKTVGERRDPKGLYRSAGRGEIVDSTDIDAPCEYPAAAEVRLRSLSIRQAVRLVVEALDLRGLAGRPVELVERANSGGHDAQRVKLTVREQEILALIELGLSNKEIARQLAITLATVKNHVHNILYKSHATRRGQAVALLRDGELSLAQTASVNHSPSSSP
jgi:adenylyl-sulfate kinase